MNKDPKSVLKSRKLENVCYDIRGPIMKEAMRMESSGEKILKLNIGNPAPFGFTAPDDVMENVIRNLPNAQGYGDSKGLLSARSAIANYSLEKKIPGVSVNDIYIGNGVSELIVMAMQGLLDNGDEVLIPMPDYPLWTAAVNLSGGKAVHYRCDEESNWYPDIKDIERKVHGKTKAIVVINPNNPTGSVYPLEILEKIVKIAQEHKLIVFADEIYDKILYDGAAHRSIASLADDLFFVTFNGLSKAYRAAGFRTGWMVLSGNKSPAGDYIEGLDILSSMRLCSNMPSQFGIQIALDGYQGIYDMTLPGGRLLEQRDTIYTLLNGIPGVSCTKPQGALYCFPKLDTAKFRITDDEKFVMDFLKEKKVLVVQGTGFNWPEPDHFRIVFLPKKEDLETAVNLLKDFLSTYIQKAN
jgi:alanine-synthesizing transaminase